MLFLHLPAQWVASRLQWAAGVKLCTVAAGVRPHRLARHVAPCHAVSCHVTPCHAVLGLIVSRDMPLRVLGFKPVRFGPGTAERSGRVHKGDIISVSQCHAVSRRAMPC